MSAPRYTVADVCAAGPCAAYPAPRISALWAAATPTPEAGLTAAQIAGLPIPPADRRWALYHVVLDAEVRWAFGAALARRALARLPEVAMAPLTRASVAGALALETPLAAALAILSPATQALMRAEARMDGTDDDLKVIWCVLRGRGYEAATIGVRAARGYSYREAGWQVATALALAMGWPRPAAPGDGSEVAP